MNKYFQAMLLEQLYGSVLVDISTTDDRVRACAESLV